MANFRQQAYCPGKRWYEKDEQGQAAYVWFWLTTCFVGWDAADYEEYDPTKEWNHHILFDDPLCSFIIFLFKTCHW